MSANALRLEYSVEAEVSLAFAWAFRTNVATWNDPPATFTLEGPFVTGAWGSTQMPGQEPLRWQIGDVRPGESFTLQMPLDGATLTFQWSFEALSAERTKMTQTILLSGDNASAYASQVEAGFGPTLADGMKRIAAEMSSAERAGQQAT